MPLDLDESEFTIGTTEKGYFEEKKDTIDLGVSSLEDAAENLDIDEDELNTSAAGDELEPETPPTPASIEETNKMHVIEGIKWGGALDNPYYQADLTEEEVYASYMKQFSESKLEAVTPESKTDGDKEMPKIDPNVMENGTILWRNERAKPEDVPEFERLDDTLTEIAIDDIMYMLRRNCGPATYDEWLIFANSSSSAVICATRGLCGSDIEPKLGEVLLNTLTKQFMVGIFKITRPDLGPFLMGGANFCKAETFCKGSLV